jgi:hypothetical protein
MVGEADVVDEKGVGGQARARGEGECALFEIGSVF